MVDEDTANKILDKVHSLYEFFDKTSKYIKDYNSKYEMSESYCNKILTFEKDNSFKSLLTDLASKNLKDTNNSIDDYNNKILALRKFILSEIAHTKAKEIDFQITNPFFFQKLRKEYRKLISELDKLDEEGIGFIEDIDKFNLKSENLIERLRNLEYEIEDEKKTGLFNLIGKIAFWGFPIIIGLYQLIAMKFLIVNPYLPLIAYAVGLCLTYLLLKSIDGIKFLLMAFKLRKSRFEVMNFVVIMSMFVVFTIMTIFSSSIDFSAEGREILPVFGTIMAFMLLILIVLISKFMIGKTKNELIEKVNKDLAKKYGLWADWT